MPEPTEPKQPKVEHDAKASKYYATTVGITATPEEFIFHIAERVIGQEEERALEVARVYLSPSHAKRLAGALARLIRNYEENFGEIIANPLKRLTPQGRKNIGMIEAEEDAPGNGNS